MSQIDFCFFPQIKNSTKKLVDCVCTQSGVVEHVCEYIGFTCN